MTVGKYTCQTEYIFSILGYLVEFLCDVDHCYSLRLMVTLEKLECILLKYFWIFSGVNFSSFLTCPRKDKFYISIGKIGSSRIQTSRYILIFQHFIEWKGGRRLEFIGLFIFWPLCFLRPSMQIPENFSHKSIFLFRAGFLSSILEYLRVFPSIFRAVVELSKVSKRSQF